MGGAMAKLLLIVLVAAAVWYAYRWINRPGAGRSVGPAAPPRPVEDMRRCPACGTYVAADAAACGRQGCPWPHKG
jgi:uncharacterized protein